METKYNMTDSGNNLLGYRRINIWYHKRLKVLVGDYGKVALVRNKGKER